MASRFSADICTTSCDGQWLGGPRPGGQKRLSQRPGWDEPDAAARHDGPVKPLPVAGAAVRKRLQRVCIWA